MRGRRLVGPPEPSRLEVGRDFIDMTNREREIVGGAAKDSSERRIDRLDAVDPFRPDFEPRPRPTVYEQRTAFETGDTWHDRPIVFTRKSGADQQEREGLSADLGKVDVHYSTGPGTSWCASTGPAGVSAREREERSELFEVREGTLRHDVPRQTVDHHEHVRRRLLHR